MKQVLCFNPAIVKDVGMQGQFKRNDHGMQWSRIRLDLNKEPTKLIKGRKPNRPSVRDSAREFRITLPKKSAALTR